MPIVRTIDRGREYGAPSHLGDVMRAIVDLFAEAGDPTPIEIGEHYATGPNARIGTPPVVILVPEPGGGACEMTPAYETGRPMGQRHTCDVIVRAAEPGDDLGRWDNAYALNNRVANAVRRAGQGKIVPGKASQAYATPYSNDTGAGAQIAWGFTFDRDVETDPSIWGVAPAAPDTTPPKPRVGSGDTGTLDTITGATAPQE